MCLSTVGDVYSSIGFRNLIKDDVLVVEWLWVSLHKSLIIGMRNHLFTLSCSKVQILWEGHTIKISYLFLETLMPGSLHFLATWFWGQNYQVTMFYVYLLHWVSYCYLVECMQSSEKNIDIKDVPTTKWPKYVMNPLLSNF